MYIGKHELEKKSYERKTLNSSNFIVDQCTFLKIKAKTKQKLQNVSQNDGFQNI